MSRYNSQALNPRGQEGPVLDRSIKLRKQLVQLSQNWYWMMSLGAEGDKNSEALETRLQRSDSGTS